MNIHQSAFLVISKVLERITLIRCTVTDFDFRTIVPKATLVHCRTVPMRLSMSVSRRAKYLGDT